jgi:hypothetical protein
MWRVGDDVWFRVLIFLFVLYVAPCYLLIVTELWPVNTI